MPAVLAPITQKLRKLLPLLSSDQPGEVVAAAAAIGRALAGAGASWHDLVAALATPAPTRRAGEIGISTILDELQQAHAILTDWERRFVASLCERAQRGRRLSPKQAATLRKIYAERIGGEG